MKTDFALLVRLIREANEGGAGRGEAERRSQLLADNAGWTTDPLDADAAISELCNRTREVSPELRYALARWIDGQITLKRGRKTTGTKRIPITGARRTPVDANLAIRALLAFGSTSTPAGVHPNTRAALADLLAGARTLKRGPRMAPPETLRTMLSAHNARLYITQGMSARAAIRRAANETGIKPGTLQRWLYPRAK